MRTPAIFRVLMKADNVAEVPEPTTSNLINVFTPAAEVPEPAQPTEAEVLYALEPDRPYDHAVDGL